MRQATTLGLVAACLTLAACGTTIDPGSVAAGRVDESMSAGGSAALGSSGNVGSGGAPSSAQPGSGASSVAPGTGNVTTGTGGASTSAGGGATGESTTARGRGAGSDRGLTTSTVLIGIANSDAQTYAKTLGLQGATFGDGPAQVNAVINNINHHGGVLGRQIKLVWYQAKEAEELNDPAQVAQAACATWTQDNHVFAVVGPYGIGLDDDLLTCLAKANTPIVGANNPNGTDGIPLFREAYATDPTFIDIGSMLGESFFTTGIDRLVARNFFQKWNTSAGVPGVSPMKLGVVTVDDAGGHAAVKTMDTELARFGIKRSDLVLLSNGSLSQSEAQQQNAVLHFRADGITHVIGAALPFMEAAQAQGYHPRYWFSNSGAGAILAATAPSGQLQGSMLESYLPAGDAGHDPGPPTAATVACLKLMRSAGQTPTWGETTLLMESICDGFNFLRAAVVASGQLSAAALVSGLESLRSSLPSAATWGTYLSPDEHASVTVVRDMSYQTNCSCYAYVSNKNYP